MAKEARRRRVAVVGGGIAGLAAAEALLSASSDVDVVVYESSGEVGGKLRVGEVAGVSVDLGAESMLSRRPEATELARRVGLADAVVHPAVTGAGIWTRHAVRPLPPTLMGIPGDLSAARSSGILSRTAALRARAERGLPSIDVTHDVGVGRLVARRLGRQVRDRLVEPLLGGVYAGRADELSLHATLPQVVTALSSHGGLLDAAAGTALASPTRSDASPEPKAPVFAGIDGGVGRLASAVAGAVDARGGSVVVGATVRELHREVGGWRLVIGPTTAAQTVLADAVIVAVPAPATRRLLRNVVPQAAGQLATIEYASVALVTMAFAPDTVTAHLTGSGFLVPPVDGHLIKAATYSSRKWDWVSQDPVIIRCSVGRYRDEEELQHSDRELVDGALLDLVDAVGLHAQLLDSRVTRWGGGLPQYAVGHLDRVRLIRESVGALPGLAVCGAAYDGVGIPAVIASAQLAATQVSDYLASDATMEP